MDLRDPLLHFLVAGAALFGILSLSADPGPAEDEIVVTAGHMENLHTLFVRTWQRPPSAAELDSLVAEHVRDEVLYREAVAMGLDRDDPVVRRRLRQKMEFVSDAIAVAEPTDAELKAFVAEHPTWFRGEPRVTFRHVYFADGGTPDAAELERLRQALDAGADPEAVGDPFLAGFAFEDLTRSQVAGTLGEELAAGVDAAVQGKWTGPVRSTYGTHLVRVDSRVEGREQPFTAIRDGARREWLHARKTAADQALYERLRARYVVSVEGAPMTSQGPAQASVPGPGAAL